MRVLSFRATPLSSALAVLAFLAPLAARSAEQKAPMSLVDFSKPATYRLAANGAGTEHVAGPHGTALSVATRTAGGYPGAVLEPVSGRWDLAGFDGVVMDVRNPEDEPLRVLLSLNNPGADGRRNTNTEAVTVPARGKATLTVPFGMWHGDPNNPIDTSNIVSVTAFLDQPDKPRRFLVDGIRAVAFISSTFEDVRATPFFKNLKPAFGRGVNLGNALEAPREGDWGVTLEAGYFRLIREAGFDHVRIPVKWSAHAAPEAPYRIDPAFFRRVDWVLQQCRANKLQAVLNMHHYDELIASPDDHRARFLALWEQIAERYKAQPDAVAFELLNEPNGALTAAKWNAMLAEGIRTVRRSNPKRKIVVGPVGWNSISELASLELPEADRNLVVTFHYYNPFTFTHQGAGWAGPDADKWLGTKWSGTRAEKLALDRDLDTAIRWAVERKRPIYMGEFGAYSKADMESRARWTRYVAEGAAARRMGSAYWEFCAGFGVYDPETKAWRKPLKDALLAGR